MKLSQALAPLVDFVYPPRCPLCGDALLAQNGLCLPCWSTLAIPSEPSCTSCQRPFSEADRDKNMICAPCLDRPPKHDGVSAGTLYNDVSRQMVLTYKYGGKIALAPLMAQLIATQLPQLEGEWLIIPVPLHRWRLWRRGFNQSALIARELHKLSGGPLIVDGLIRKKPTPPLGGLRQKERQSALKGAIGVNPKRAEKLRSANVLLVDDVLTSGATSNACIAELKRAGVEQVRLACFSRVLDEAL